MELGIADFILVFAEAVKPSPSISFPFLTLFRLLTNNFFFRERNLRHHANYCMNARRGIVS